jgi:hypothetical protein
LIGQKIAGKVGGFLNFEIEKEGGKNKDEEKKEEFV